MNLTLVFSRKYSWPENHFSVWSLGNSRKLLTTNQFLVSTIFFIITNNSFFSLRFDLFSIIAKEVNQIRNNAVCIVACLVFSFCFALTMDGWLQYFSAYFPKLKEIGVLRPIFPDYVISCDYVVSLNQHLTSIHYIKNMAKFLRRGKDRFQIIYRQLLDHLGNQSVCIKTTDT